MKRACIHMLGTVAAAALMLTPSNNASAKILFVETFSTGEVPDPTVWKVSDTPDEGLDFYLQEDVAGQGPGDGLLVIAGTVEGGSPKWGDQIYTLESFPRGENIRVSYRMWVKFGTNALAGFHGGFHHTDSGPIYNTFEAGVDYTYTDLRWGEAIGQGYPNGIQGGASLTGLNSNFAAGNTKNGSLLIETTLGDERGARLGWYKTDRNSVNNNFNASEIDTIGLMTQPGGSRVTGDRESAHIGFGNNDNNFGSVYIDDIFIENDEIANPGGPWVLYVGSTRDYRPTSNQGGHQSPGGDFRLRWLLEQRGYNVEYKNGWDATAADAEGKVAVLISSTASSGVVLDTFTNSPVGVMTWNNGLFDDLNLTNAAGATTAEQTSITIDSPDHPLAAGKSGTVTVAVNFDAYRSGAPQAEATGALKIASIVGQPDHTAILAYEAGSQMDNGATAPARRVGYFLGVFRSGETLTDDGKDLFMAAVDWVAGGAAPPDILGDINGDGVLNVADITLLGNLLDAETPPPSSVGDVNGDSQVDEQDLSALANLIVD